MTTETNITVRIGRGNVNHPAHIVDGHKVLACGCPNTANGHGALAAQTVAFGWAAVNCKRGASHRAAAGQIVDASEASKGGKIVTSITYGDGRTVQADGIVKAAREWLNA